MTDAGTSAGKTALLASAATSAIGLGVLAGWLLHVRVLTSLVPGAGSMNPMTGTAFVLSGASLALALLSTCSGPQRSRACLLAARVCALVVVITGFLKFSGYMLEYDLPLDHWLVDAARTEAAGWLISYMAPNTALNFLLLGSALLLVKMDRPLIRFCSETFVAIVGLEALTAVLGHLYHVHALYDFGRFTPMSFYTGFAFLVISTGYFLARTDQGLLAILAGKGSGGSMARILLPTALLIPSILGWLSLKGQATGFYHRESAEAFFAVGNIVVFTFVICWSARSLFRADCDREKSERELEWQTALLRAQLNSSIDGIVVVDQESNKIIQNQRMAELFGIPPDIAADRNDERQLKWVAEAVKDSAGFLEKVFHLNAHPDETSQDEIELLNGATLERYSARVAGKDGAFYGRIWTFRDITNRRKAEESLRLLHSAVLQSDEIILITEADLDSPGPTIVFVNPAFTNLTGYSSDEVLGQSPRILQGPLTSRAVLRRLRENLKNGESFENEIINYRKDGTAYELEWKIAPLRDFDGTVTHFVALQHDVTARRKAEGEARMNEQRYRSLIEATTAIVWDTPPSGEFLTEQPGWSGFTGQSFEELAGWGWMNAIHPDDRAATKQVWSTAIANRSIYEVEHRLRARDQTYHDMSVRAVPIVGKDGEITQWLGVHTDVTARKQLEVQLFQSQKLETIGKLAGGVAHEFNSILTAIIGQSEILMGELPQESRLVKNAIEINKAAGRAAALTRQLLAYGRKQILRPEVLDLNRVLHDMEGTLRHLMSDVNVLIASQVGLKMVKVDAGQIEQVIMNMAINARDAMPNGGRLTLETTNVSLSADTLGLSPEAKPGEYVVLAISDTGMGMSADLRARIFEPFFSTKEVGQGAGLGLSTCYGIIKQSGGHISVYSEPLRGSTFKVYLPQIEPLLVPIPSLNSTSMPRGTETILLVEDDPALREMAADLLGRLGYRVLSAANGIDALSLKHQQDSGYIDLLFTDIVMPHMSGRELSERVRMLSPHTKILFTSSYSENAVLHHGVLEEGVMLLQKPFSPSVLARKLRDVLDQPQSVSL